MAIQNTPDGRIDEMRGLEYPCGEAPAAGEIREIQPGLLWLRMPLPFALNHINLWAIADHDDGGPGWAIVDTGTQTPEAIAAWRTLIAPDGPLASTPQGARLTKVICTHMHPDHVGMAGWLTRKFDCRLWMTRLEYLTCRTLVADTGREAPADAIRFFQQHGWHDEAIDLYRARFGGFGRYIHPLPDSYRRLSDGETLAIGGEAWRVVVGRGHSPEHASLLCESRGVIVSGDQILPHISSNVSVHPTEPEADPLGEWLDSIAMLRGLLDPQVLVLPAHGPPFKGVHNRLERLANGHNDGLKRVRARLDEPKRAIDLFGALFARPIDDPDMLLGLATGESIAHLNYLVARGEVVTEVGSDGIRRYRLAA